jgi:hypothetical protein
MNSMKALVDTAEQAWLDEAKAALNGNRVSFARRYDGGRIV